MLYLSLLYIYKLPMSNYQLVARMMMNPPAIKQRVERMIFFQDMYACGDMEIKLNEDERGI